MEGECRDEEGVGGMRNSWGSPYPNPTASLQSPTEGTHPLTLLPHTSVEIVLGVSRVPEFVFISLIEKQIPEPGAILCETSGSKWKSQTQILHAMDAASIPPTCAILQGRKASDRVTDTLKKKRRAQKYMRPFLSMEDLDANSAV